MSANPATRESKRPGITVPRPGRAPEPGALPVEVDDEEIDDAELTAAEDGDGPAAALPRAARAGAAARRRARCASARARP